MIQENGHWEGEVNFLQTWTSDRHTQELSICKVLGTYFQRMLLSHFISLHSDTLRAEEKQSKHTLVLASQIWRPEYKGQIYKILF